MEENNTYRHNSGFKVPENYFDGLEDRILASVASDSPEKRLSENTAGFRVPEGYFDSLEDRILEQVGQPAKRGALIPLFRSKKLLYAAAVAAVFIGLVSTLLLRPIAEISFDDMELSALENYIDEGYLDFNLNEITSFMYEEGYAVDNLDQPKIDNEALLEYLDENIEDPAYLLE